MKNLLIGLAIALVIVTGVVIFTAPEKDSGGNHSGSNHSGNRTESHECYVCGEKGNLKYGSFYYCATHYAMVKTVTEAGE